MLDDGDEVTLALPVAHNFSLDFTQPLRVRWPVMEIQNQVSGRILRDNLARLRDVLDGAVSAGRRQPRAGR